MDTFPELMQHVEGVELDQLRPLTTLLVWTWNTLYQVVVTAGSDVLVQGGPFFSEPTAAHIDGASTGRSLVKPGWIGLGLLMEFHVMGKRLVTSPVVAIATERPSTSMVQ